MMATSPANGIKKELPWLGSSWSSSGGAFLAFSPDLFRNLSNLELALNKDEDQNKGEADKKEKAECGHWFFFA
jgi:hypothetical protein